MSVESASARQLIVNADDFGRSHGINRGIFTAHHEGIVTSASVMVRWPAARDAAAYARDSPALDLGLHLDLAEWLFTTNGWRPHYEVVDHCNVNAVRDEAWRQIERFDQLCGAYPTHLDSHQHVHRTEPVRSTVLEVASELGVVVRDEDQRVAYCGEFHGQSGHGEPLTDSITPEALTTIVCSLGPGITELACHPAVNDESGSVYGTERDAELIALCHPMVRAVIEEGEIVLRNFRGLRGERPMAG
jgi:predicted glycoside hydrolase/deacetylase ChbG (UPF0249 family)